MKKKPTFICDTCGKEFPATKIGGVWYAVNKEHFRDIRNIKKVV